MPQNQNQTKDYDSPLASLQGEIDAILEPFNRADDWRALQVPQFPNPSSAVLFTGPPGTGKTTLSLRLAKKISGLNIGEIPCISMADVGSGKLGETEKSIKYLFAQAKKLTTRKVKPAKFPVAFMDEVDAICWNRALITQDTTFMLSIVNTLLLEIDKFMNEGGAMFFSTNHPDKLDPAFISRMTNLIQLNAPTGADALRIWKSLMPPPPFGFPPIEAHASLGWTPREIKNWIFKESRRAFLARENMNPKVKIND